MKPQEMHKTFRAFTYEGDKLFPIASDLLAEVPLEIAVNGGRRVLIMVTPGLIRELVVGFLFTEGLIRDRSEIEDCRITDHSKNDGDRLIEAVVTLPFWKETPSKSAAKRISYSSCGICGKENYYELKHGVGRVKSRQTFSMGTIMTLPEQLAALQPLYRKTGGAHAAVLFDRDGRPLFHCEDMGRHNALDKVIGTALLHGTGPQDKIVLSSGRASLEMILKTARAGFPVFVAMSRPTSRAVEAAKFYNVTLIDLAKDSNRLYSHVRRIEEYR